MKKKLSDCLRKAAAKKSTHYTAAVIGLILILTGAETIRTDSVFTAAVLIVIGAVMIIHAIWFLDEILGAFSGSRENDGR